jgi:hypothetical protein
MKRVLCLLLVLVGCGFDAKVLQPPNPDSNIAQICEAAVANLPEVVDGVSQVSTNPKSPYTAAWGDPAITLRCGAEFPADYSANASLVSVNDLDWFSSERVDAYVFTNTSSEVFIEITVPIKDSSPAGALAQLAPWVKSVINTP